MVPARCIGVVLTGTQIVWGDLLEEPATGRAAAAEVAANDAASTLTATVRTVASIPDLLRAIPAAKEDYLVFSARPQLIWDRQLLQRVAREIAAVEVLDIPWFCLCADGMDVQGRQYSSAFFNHEPTLVPDRGRRLIVQTAGTLYVVRSATLRALGLQPKILPDLVAFMNSLVTVGYGRGFASLFTSGLYPCLTEHQSLDYMDLDRMLAGFQPNALLAPVDAVDLFPPGVPRQALVAAWVGTLASVLRSNHAFSFVIRTLFRRNHMLRRCLISIEYLRSSLNIPVEIVLATDVDEPVVDAAVRALAEEFPNLTFTVAHGGRYQGHSRVRNLVAGLQATTGTRVCIIDDDDYYTPQAVGSFAQACEFGTEWLVIFDTQVIEEKWISASAKHHREIAGYGIRFDATSWATTLRGSNSIPLCGVIHPGWFARQVACEYVYDFDLSEDFVFHLLCFAHPKRPPIKTIDGVCAYQSHRIGDDNVSNVTDRTGWVVDTGNGLFQLLFEQGRSFDAISATEASSGAVHARDRVAILEAEVVRSNRGRAQATRLLAELVKRATGSAS